MSTHATVTSVVAKYLSSAPFREALAAGKQEALASCGLSPTLNREFSRFDFQALESFGGLITKTQHNFLYEDLPHTRRLLRIYGLDLTVFADYRSVVQSGNSRAGSRAEKTCRFVSYLMAWLEGKDRIAPGLADVLKHEFILYGLKAEAVRITGEAAQSFSAKPAASNPVLQPGVRLAEFERDPLRIIERLEQGEAVATGRRRRCCLVYQVKPEQITTFRPGRLVWNMLRLIDGQKSLTVLQRLLRPMPRAAMRELLLSLETSELVCVGAPK